MMAIPAIVQAFSVYETAAVAVAEASYLSSAATLLVQKIPLLLPRIGGGVDSAYVIVSSSVGLPGDLSKLSDSVEEATKAAADGKLAVVHLGRDLAGAGSRILVVGGEKQVSQLLSGVASGCRISEIGKGAEGSTLTKDEVESVRIGAARGAAQTSGHTATQASGATRIPEALASAPVQISQSVGAASGITQQHVASAVTSVSQTDSADVAVQRDAIQHSALPADTMASMRALDAAPSVLASAPAAGVATSSAWYSALRGSATFGTAPPGTAALLSQPGWRVLPGSTPDTVLMNYHDMGGTAHMLVGGNRAVVQSQRTPDQVADAVVAQLGYNPDIAHVQTFGVAGYHSEHSNVFQTLVQRQDAGGFSPHVQLSAVTFNPGAFGIDVTMSSTDERMTFAQGGAVPQFASGFGQSIYPSWGQLSAWSSAMENADGGAVDLDVTKSTFEEAQNALREASEQLDAALDDEKQKGGSAEFKENVGETVRKGCKVLNDLKAKHPDAYEAVKATAEAVGWYARVCAYVEAMALGAAAGAPAGPPGMIGGAIVGAGALYTAEKAFEAGAEVVTEKGLDYVEEHFGQETRNELEQTVVSAQETIAPFIGARGAGKAAATGLKAVASTKAGRVVTTSAMLHFAEVDAAQLAQPLRVRMEAKAQPTSKAPQAAARGSARAPVSPQAWAKILQERYPNSVVESSTALIPSATTGFRNLPNAKMANGFVTTPSGAVVHFSAQGFPVFDTHTVFTGRLPDHLWASSHSTQFTYLTKDLAAHLDRYPADKANFTPKQLADIAAGKPKIDGLTWHHTEHPGVMQSVPSDVHSVGHAGGNRQGGWSGKHNAPDPATTTD